MTMRIVRNPTATLEPASPDPVLKNARMRALYTLVRKLAPSTLPVLITGETGVGKELVARALHEASGRRGPFVAVNSSVFPDQLAASALFGHEKGAFTGAERQTRGLLEEANGGTLFLDEVDELSPFTQVLLLRALQEKRFRRIGSNDEISVDVRVVAATNRDLHALTRTAGFREDLYYRIAGGRLFVPPLRERPEDIPALASEFLRLFVAEQNEGCTLDGSAMAALLGYWWPGNVRELRSVVEVAAAVRSGIVIHAEDLCEVLREQNGGTGSTTSSSGPRDRGTDGLGPPLRHRVRSYEAAVIQEALEEARGSVSETARRLRVSLRTLNTKLTAYGIRSNAAPTPPGRH